MDAALGLLRAAQADGVQTIVATSHVNDRYRNDAAGLAGALADLRRAAAGEGIAVGLRPGAEIALSRLADLSDGDLRGLALGGGPNLLIESPLSPSAADFDFLIEDLQERGHGVVLAHPERCPAFQREPQRLTRLVAGGVRCSVTASALVGRFGEPVRRFSARLLRDGLVHDLASDAHDLQGRRPEVAGPVAVAQRDLPGLELLAGWLTHEAPAAILAGRPVGAAPARLPAAAGRPWWRWRRPRRAD